MGTGMKVWLFLLSVGVMASLTLQVATLDKLDYVRYLAHQAAASSSAADRNAWTAVERISDLTLEVEHAAQEPTYLIRYGNNVFFRATDTEVEQMKAEGAPFSTVDSIFAKRRRAAK
jgi:Tfp pilus assembly protein PilV